MNIEELNTLPPSEFVKTLGWIFEDSPWVAERAVARRPFESIDALHAAMVDEVRTATRDEQLALLRAHPDLGTSAKMSAASIAEQAGAGLDQLRPDEFEHLQALNLAYRQKFGFPFLFAVKGSSRRDILFALLERFPRSAEQEFREALTQVYRIAAFRLAQLTESK